MDIIDTTVESQATKSRPSTQMHPRRRVVSWLLTWEVYPIIALAAFLRFYQWSTTAFDADQAAIYGMARNAVMHGLIPITTNASSLGVINPPATVYLLMLGAVFSPNPYAGFIVVALLNVLAVVLTYVIVRRYFGRIAGTFSALLYAVALQTVFYSRFIWNQNMLAPFVLLFLLAMLWGVMERRHGWLAPAVLLWGWMIQLHASAIFLIIPLLVACVLAFKTLRWRDIFLSAGLLALIYAPYIVWEVATHFGDVQLLLQNLHHPTTFDTQSLKFYLSYISERDFIPTIPVAYTPPAEAGSWGFKLFSLLHWDYRLMLLLLAGSYILALFAACQSRWPLLSFARGEMQLQCIPRVSSRPISQRLLTWWRALLASPGRSALLLLLSWQILPVLVLTRHSFDLFGYYLLILMPGPFILMGISAAQVMEWLAQHTFSWPGGRGVRYGFSLLLAVLVVAQFVGTWAWIQDDTRGFHPNGAIHHSLGDMQRALATADSLAQAHHLHHIYIDTDTTTVDSFNYLAPQMQTSYTLLSANTAHCLMLPNSSQGPAVMLFGPNQQYDEALLTHFASATLVSESNYTGGPPFQLYIVQPFSLLQSQESFVHTLVLGKSLPAIFTWQAQGKPATHLLATFWTNLSQQPARENTTYTYHFDARSAANGASGLPGSTECRFTSLTPGEHLLVPFQLPKGSVALPTTLTLSGSSWITQPADLHYGPFHFESILNRSTRSVPFKASSGGENIVLQNT